MNFNRKHKNDYLNMVLDLQNEYYNALDANGLQNINPNKNYIKTKYPNVPPQLSIQSGIYNYL